VAHEPSLSLDDAARRLGVSRRTVYSRIRSGALVTLRVGRSQRALISSIDALLLLPRIRRAYHEKAPKPE
jgi:excisionase family DNA binding protein